MTILTDLSMDIAQSISIDAPIDDAYAALLRRLAEENSSGDNQPMPMVLEPWPGGRWYRDLGDQQGHLWGFVQVIKPPKLIEIQGPLFMSYAVAGHLQFRLTKQGEGSELTMRHQVLGVVAEEHRQGLTKGWTHMLQGVKGIAEN